MVFSGDSANGFLSASLTVGVTVGVVGRSSQRSPFMPKQVAIYTRVSTDHQTTENQERELRAIADRMGWIVVKVYRDQGISGAKSRKDRPAFDALWKDAARGRFDMIMAWSVDRLGRSLQDLIAFLSDVHGYGVDLFLHQQGVDTRLPSAPTSRNTSASLRRPAS